MKAAFRTTLKVEPASEFDDGRWRLVAPLVYYTDVLGRELTVPEGFVTDFASVPRIPIVYELCGDTSSEASAVHDFLYTTHPCVRSQADAILYEASAITGVPLWRRFVMWLGVRLFGWSHWGK